MRASAHTHIKRHPGLPIPVTPFFVAVTATLSKCRTRNKSLCSLISWDLLLDCWNQGHPLKFPGDCPFCLSTSTYRFKEILKKSHEMFFHEHLFLMQDLSNHMFTFVSKCFLFVRCDLKSVTSLWWSGESRGNNLYPMWGACLPIYVIRWLWEWISGIFPFALCWVNGTDSALLSKTLWILVMVKSRQIFCVSGCLRGGK